MPEVKAARAVREALFAAFEEMVDKAMKPDIPIPQRQALFNRAQELRAQWIELEAARFNKDAEVFEKAQTKVSDAVTDLRRAIQDLDDMVKIAEKASKVFGLVDKLMKQAVKFVAF
jgi:hypothetical protein